MNLDALANRFVGGLMVALALTTVFGRRNSAAVFNSIGTAGANLMRASLGAGAGVQ